MKGCRLQGNNVHLTSTFLPGFYQYFESLIAVVVSFSYLIYFVQSCLTFGGSIIMSRTTERHAPQQRIVKFNLHAKWFIHSMNERLIQLFEMKSSRNINIYRINLNIDSFQMKQLTKQKKMAYCVIIPHWCVALRWHFSRLMARGKKW